MLIVAGPVGDLQHVVPGHIERPERITAALDGLEDLHLGTDLLMVEPQQATMDSLLRVHDPRYLNSLALMGQGWIDPDTYVTSDSFQTALLAAGAGITAAQMIENEPSSIGFVLARPPGHHAGQSRGMGFCLINNVAVLAAHLLSQGQRVLIVDWDVHHGNGTQSIFYDEERVLYVSTHQWPLYPGTGRADEVGGSKALGLTVNIPLPAKATGDVLRAALNEVVAPAVQRFGPSWTLVSAGFDAHRADPLADLSLSAGDFADLARTVRGLARTKMVIFLEGGYDLGALRMSVAATCSELMGGSTPMEAPTSGGPGMEAVAAAGRLYRQDERVRAWLES